MLLRFSKQDEKINLQTTSLENETGAKISPYRIYSFDDKASIERILSILLEFQKTPAEGEKKSSQQMGQVIQLLSFMGSKDSEEYALLEAKLEGYNKILEFLKDENNTYDDLVDNVAIQEYLKYANKPCSVQNVPLILPDTKIEGDASVQNKLKELCEHQIETLKKPVADGFAKLQAKRGDAPATLEGDKTPAAELIDRLIQTEGGEPQALPKELQRLVKSSDDWSKLFPRWLEAADPSFKKEHMLSLETNYLFNYTDALLKEINENEGLPFHQKLEMLLDIERAAKKLEKHYRKAYGPEAFQSIWKREAEGKIGEVRVKLREMREELNLNQYKNLDQTITPKYQWQASAASIPFKGDLSKSKELHMDFLLEHHSTFTVFQHCMEETRSSHQAQEYAKTTILTAKEELSKLLEDCKVLVEQGRYQELEQISTAVMSMLDPPKSSSEDALGTLLWDTIPLEDIEAWSKGVTQFSQYMWDAHLKLNREALWPSQASALMVSRAILVNLMRRQASAVKSQALKNFDALPNEEKDKWLARLTAQKMEGFPEALAGVEGSLLADFRKNPALAAEFLKELGLTSDQALLLAFEGYPTDVQQIRYIINEHPYFHFGRNPKNEDLKMRAVLDYFAKDIENPTVKPLLLDDWANCGEEEFSDWEFLKLSKDVINAYGEIKGAVTEDQIWSESWRREGHPFLPQSAIDLRRHVVFTQMLLHPESTCFKGFNSTFELRRWCFNLATAVTREAADYESQQRLANEKVSAEVKESIAKMGPLDIYQKHVGQTSENIVQISDEKGGAWVQYFPTGPKFFDYRNPFHDEAILGQQDQIPRSFITGSVAANDFRSSKGRAAERKREIDVKEPLTEVTVAVEEHVFPTTSLDPVINAQLRTLVIRDADGNATPGTVYNVLDFIFKHPHLLENEAVQRTLEHALTSTGAIQSLLSTNPEFFIQSNFGEKLQKGIEFALNNDRIYAAAFLMHTGELLKIHTDQASASFELDPSRKDLLEKISSSLPGSFSEYQFKKKPEPMSGIDILRTYLASDDVDIKTKKFIYTHLMRFIQQDPGFKLNYLFSVAEGGRLEQNSIDLFMGYAYLKNVGDDTGSPMLQDELIKWMEKVVIPYFSISKNRALILQTLSEAGRHPKTVHEWETVGDLIYQNKVTKALVNFKAGIYQKEGFKASLPKEVSDNSSFAQLFGNDNPEVYVKATRGEALQYSFSKGGRKFRIDYDPKTKGVVIYQKIKADETSPAEIKGKEKTSPAEWYAFVEIDNRESEPLFKRFGIWKNIKNPKQGYLILNSPEKWKSDDVFQVDIDWYGKIQNPRSVKQDEYLFEDAEGRFLGLFPFAAKDDIILTRGRKEYQVGRIRFLSKNMAFARKEGAWIGQGEAEGYSLLKEPQKLKFLTDRFGPHFQKFMLPLQKIDPATNVEQIRCVLFPVRILPQTVEERKEGIIKVDPQRAVDLPALKVTIETGKADSEEGRMQSSTAGFMYLAYQAYAAGEYERAAHMLGTALENPYIPQETKALEQILSHIQDHPDDSSQGVAFKLKTLLAARQILRDQQGIKEYRPEDWQGYIENIRREIDLFQNYLNKVENLPSGEGKKRLLGESLLLSEHEIRQYQQLLQESMEFLVEHGTVPDVFAPQSAKPFRALQISESNLGEFVNELSRQMVDPKNSKAKLEELTLYPHPDEFLKNFWSYSQQIAKDNIKPNDWRIQKLKSMVLAHLEPDQARVIEIGRQLLMEMAVACDSEGVSAFVKEIKTISEELPQQNVNVQTILMDFEDQAFEAKANPVVPAELFQQAEKWIKPYHSGEVSDYRKMHYAASMIASNLLGRFSVAHKLPTEISAELQRALMPLAEFHNHRIDLQAFAEEQRKDALPPPPVFDKKADKGEDSFSTTKEKLRAAIDSPDSPLSATERMYWRAFLDEAGPKMPVEKELAIVELLQMFVKQGIHMPSLRHETEGLREIAAIQNRPAKPLNTNNENVPFVNFEYVQNQVKEAGKNYSILIDHFAAEAWKPSSAEIKNGEELFARNDLAAHAFAKEYNNVLNSQNQDELKKMIEKCRTHSMTYVRHIRTHSMPIAFEWYLSAAAQIRVNELNMGMKATTLTSLNLKEGSYAPSNSVSVEAFFKDLDRHLIDSQMQYRMQLLESQSESIMAYYANQEDLTPMERVENIRLSDACEKVLQEKIEGLSQYRGVVAESSLLSLEENIKGQHKTCQSHVKEHKIQIFELLQKNARYLPALKELLSKPEMYGEAEILEKTLDLFKANRLIPSLQVSEERRTEFNALEEAVVLFLYDATEAQQLVKALKSVEDLKNLSAGKKSGTIEWEEKSAELLGYLESAAKRGRYIDQNKECLASGHARKHLVAEYRSEVIARDYQPGIVEQLVENPNILILLRPGAGKSKWIMPEAAQLLAQEKGKLPIIFITDELVHINRQDMDKATREMFRQAGHVFDFDRKTPKDIPYLMDEYKRLLHVKQSEGYIITTIARMAALDDEIWLTKDEMTKAYGRLTEYIQQKPSLGYKDLLADQEFIKLYGDVVELQKQHHWLLKIHSLFHRPDVQFIADEVDDIFNINRDYNYSIGDKGDPPNPDLSRTMHHIMDTIMESSEGRLADLRDKLIHNKQALLNGTFLEKGQEIPKTKPYMQDIARQIYHQKEAFGLSSAEWENLKEGVSEEEFVDFVTGDSDSAPKGYQNLSGKVSETNHRYISALKHFLTLTLPNALTQEAEVNFGLAPDGCAIVPRDKGQEIPNVRYGDEHELVAFQYLYYASKIPSFEYFKEQFRKQEDLIAAQVPKALNDWGKWVEEAQVDDKTANERFKALYQKLQAPESWRQRFAILRDDILPKRIDVFHSQVKCNAQDPLFGADVSGASGTVNEYSLPDRFERDGTVYSRDVSADTFFRLAGTHPGGFNALVEVFENPEQTLIEQAKIPDRKFIVDQGAAMEGQTALDMVKKFRAAGINRQFLFVDPLSRKQMMWNPSEDAPRSFDRAKLDPNCLVYFAAPDIRGTDWPIPPGSGVLITGPTTTDEVFLQAIWRARRLGQGQTVDLFISKALAHAYNEAGSKDPDASITYGQLMNEIKKCTLDQKGLINHKAASHKIRQILPQQVKKELFKPYIEDEAGYWNFTKEDPSGLLRLLSDVAADCALFDACRGLYIQTRKVDFDADFAPQSPIPTVNQLESQYAQQQKKTQQEIEKFQQVPGEVGRAIGKVAKSITGAAIPYVHPETRERMKTVLHSVEGIPEQVDNALRDFKESIEKHESHLKPEISSSTAESGNSQEQVQEQEQQQQQQQQMVAAQLLKTGRPSQLTVKPHQWNDWPKRLREADSVSGIPVLKALQSDFESVTELKNSFVGVHALAEQDCGFDPDIFMSSNYAKLWNEISVHEGDLMGRIVMLEGEGSSTEKGKEKQGREFSLRFILVDQLDLDRGIAPDILSEKQQKSGKEKEGEGERALSAAVFSLYPAHKDAPPLTLLMSTSTGELPYQEEQVFKKLVQVKIIAGSLSFVSEQEQDALKNWIQNLNAGQKEHLLNFISKIHGVETPSQIPGWQTSTLREFLIK